MSLRRSNRVARTARAQSTSSLHVSSVSSQPTVRVVQPSPRISRTRSVRPLTQPTPPFPIIDMAENEILACPICTVNVGDNAQGLCCEQCFTWFHAQCLYMSDTEYEDMAQSAEKWFCDHCSSVRANKLKWGTLEGEHNISDAVKSAYNKIITWKKNLFSLPRGKCGSDFIRELTRLLCLFSDKTRWERLSLPLAHIFIPLMLQKPSQKSKAKDHVKYLTSRLEKWKDGDLINLLNEGHAIQARMVKSKARKAESRQKAFCRLMLAGKVGQACKFVNNSDSINGVHNITTNIKQALLEKHPKAEKLHNEGLLPITRPMPNQVIYEQLTAEVIQRSCKNLSGSGGPTLVDADAWKYFLCSRSYGKLPFHLAEAVSGLAKRLCTEEVHPDCLEEFVACRLIPLDKGNDKHGNPGIRPIGIGETLRRIVGRSVTTILKADIQLAGGCLQTCTGLRSGIEAAVHANTESWLNPSTEGLLQVDADNAFNRLNRKVALHNIREVCPSMKVFLHNHYQKAAKLSVSTNFDPEIIFYLMRAAPKEILRQCLSMRWVLSHLLMSWLSALIRRRVSNRGTLTIVLP